MTSSILIVIAVVPLFSSGSAGLTDEATLAIAEQSFAEGVALRNDSLKAHPAFARSAIGYDELWQRGYHDPDLALNRAHAHQLAGDLPGAIAALQEGLAAARWNRALQIALENARGAVDYPLGGDLANQCRPTALPTIGSRMSPIEGWATAAFLWMLTCGGIARFAMTRARLWLMSTGWAIVLLLLLGGLWFQDYRLQQRESAEARVIVNQDAPLRRGNSESYPARLESKLPRGVEAWELSRRGGWVQVRLAGGVVGWLPETAVLVVGLAKV
jgi:hypothetical protein